MAIQITLKKLGLSDKEIKVYLALLKNGKTKPSVLAAITKLNRATLYNVAKELLSKGIISEDLSEKVLYFSPLPPENLKGILEQTKRELKEKEALIKKAVGELSLITAGATYPVPKMRFIQEKDLEKFLFDNLVKWQKAVIASDDGIWRGFQDHSFIENYENWIKETWKTKESKDEHYDSRVLTNESRIERKLKGKYGPKRNVRFLKDSTFTATVWVCGDFLIMISTRQHPFYLFEIHDKLLAHNMQELFKKLWTTSTHHQ